MKSYLSLIPISAKVHRRQNRMTLLCIIFAVFLVTAVFSMAEMGVRMEEARLLTKHKTLTLQSIMDSEMGRSLFPIAAVLFLLILTAGVLMISSSINSNVVQRVKFFGMMRCIGMSKEQITRFVRLEALNWCKTAIPIGVVLGVVVTWGLCAALRFLVGEEFSAIPLFAISITGIICGIAVGIAAVVIAAGSPAKRAARVSPITAVSGNAGSLTQGYGPINTGLFKIETALGIRHAVSAKKSLVLMTGSFALSIILFLSFSVLIDFVGYIMPQSHADADIEIVSNDGSNSIDSALLETIRGMEGVKEVYGRRSSFDVPAQFNKESLPSGEIDIISYDEFDLDCLVKDGVLKKGSHISSVYGDSDYVLATWDKDSPLELGDQVQIGNGSLEIAGMLKYDPFTGDGSTNGKVTLITSGETFGRLTGIRDYSLVLIQTTRDAADEDVAAIGSVVGDNGVFQDRRDQRTTGTYMAFLLFVYGFLTIITLVTVLNIMNNISMSVSARMKQYGAMRAVGMDERQLTKMITAEALTYALIGSMVGCGVGLLISKLVYHTLIASHFTYATWSFPAVPLTVILLFVFIAVIGAVYAPSKRIRNISVTETLNEQ